MWRTSRLTEVDLFYAAGLSRPEGRLLGRGYVDELGVASLSEDQHIDRATGQITACSAPVGRIEAARCGTQLLAYRLRSMPAVIASEFENVVGLSPEANAIAATLGKCVVDAPLLQAEIVSLLTPFSDHQLAERTDDLGTLAVGAALALCHQGKDQVRVGEIAAEVNRVQKDRGERLQFSAEKVAHRLKRAGLLTRRLGASGNGLLFDRVTKLLLHEVASAYGCGGSTNGKENLHCPLCVESK